MKTFQLMLWSIYHGFIHTAAALLITAVAQVVFGIGGTSLSFPLFFGIIVVILAIDIAHDIWVKNNENSV